MKILNDAMKDMKITNSFEDLYFLYKFHKVVAFSGLGEDQNISLATNRWKINSRWKTPSVDRCIAETIYTIETFFKHQSKVVKTSDRRVSSQRRHNSRGNIEKEF